MLPTAFVLVALLTNNANVAVTSITVPGIASEQACHVLAEKMFLKKHACIEYRIAATGFSDNDQASNNDQEEPDR
jgi:hypothetical protein